MYIYEDNEGTFYIKSYIDCEDMQRATFIGEAHDAEEARYLLYDKRRVLDDDEAIDKALNEDDGLYNWQEYNEIRHELDAYVNEWFNGDNNESSR